MMLAVILLGIAILYITARLLHLASPAEKPHLFFRDSDFNNNIIKACSLLTEIYVPPLFWGKSGHLQTFIYGKLGRVKSPFPRGKRYSTVVEDGATVTYDVFQSLRPHPTQGDYTVAVCPGLANSSESIYVRTFTDYAQRQGYRVAVLNHLGAIQTIPLTAPRIFTYGGFDEYGLMVSEVQKEYPSTQLILVGFSMGGNIIMNYLADDSCKSINILCGISCCQGYDANAAQPLLLTWEHCRRLYLYVMTQHQKGLIRHHKDILLGPQAKEKYGALDENKIFAATSLVELDENYSRRRAGFPSLYEYYKSCSCKHIMHKVQVPMFILNARDDPIVPSDLHEPARDMAMERDNVIFAVTAHGGHLGFFEGGSLIPDPVTWLDKIVIQFSNAMIQTTQATS